MDEHTLKNEVNNQQGLIQAVNQGIYNSPITQNFYNAHEQIWSTQICPIKDLRLESFKLGDDAAANFPYLIDPLREEYSQAIQALQEASDPIKRIKGGILLLGESNAGKTRLALEALKQVLPEWLLLRWQPYYTSNHIPPIQALGEKSLVLMLDDLHEYISARISSLAGAIRRDDPYSGMAPAFENPRVTALRALLETLLQVTSNVVIVATCRSEYLENVNAEFGDHLLIRLRKLHLPSFHSNSEDSQVTPILAAFEQKGPIHLEDWDGTIGSLILGLSRKHDQYAALPEYARIVLKAIKLLAHAATFSYPEQHIRKICTGIFPKARNLQGDELWLDTMDLLLQHQFVIEDSNKTSGEPNLTIRSDSYLERVIADYPPTHRPTRLEQDLSRLVEILLDLGDAEALARLAFSFSMRGLYEKALEVFDRSLVLNDNDTMSWTNKGVCLTLLNRVEEALQAYKRAIEISNGDVFAARINEGHCLELLNQYDEALDSFEQILSLYPEDAYSWERKGLCLAKLGQYDKALESLDRALSLDAGDVDAWYSNGFPLAANAWRTKGFCLSMLEQPNKAIEALDFSLSFDVSNAGTWKLRGICFTKLEQYNEAVKSYKQAIAINPDDATVWHGKGKCLGLLGKHEEALKAFEQALIHDPEDINAWYDKAVCLEQLGQLSQSIEAFEHASSFVEWERCLFMVR